MKIESVLLGGFIGVIAAVIIILLFSINPIPALFIGMVSSAAGILLVNWMERTWS